MAQSNVKIKAVDYLLLWSKSNLKTLNLKSRESDLQNILYQAKDLIFKLNHKGRKGEQNDKMPRISRPNFPYIRGSNGRADVCIECIPLKSSLGKGVRASNGCLALASFKPVQQQS